MKLTQKQRLFADEYIKSGNATQAYIKAGYKASDVTARRNGSRLLTNAHIKSYIDGKMAEIESHKIADAKEAMQAITAIARGETTETQAQINPLSGEWEKTEVPADLKTRLAAWREILKRYPLADELTKAQLRKANAEAELADLNVEERKQQLKQINGSDNSRNVDDLEQAVKKGMDDLYGENDEIKV